MLFRVSQKNLSRILAFAVLVVFFWLALLLLDQKNDSLKLDISTTVSVSDSANISKTSPQKTNPNITLQDFQRTSQEEDQLNWELNGKTIDLYSEENLIEILDPKIKTFQNPEDPLAINSQKATVLFKENDIDEADLNGQVIIKNKIYEITTEQAKFNKKRNQITSEQAITIINQKSTIKGVGLIANLATEVFNVRSKVDSVIQGEKKTFKITSEKLLFDNQNAIFTYSGNVLATDGEYVIKSEKLIGHLTKEQDLEKLFATDSVIITKGTTLRTYSERADFDFIKNMIVLTEDPELEKENSVLSAEVIKYNMETEQSTADGEVNIKLLEDAKLEQPINQ